MDGFLRYSQLLDIEDDPNSGLTEKDFFEYAKQHFSLAFNGTSKAEVEELLYRWVDHNFGQNENVSEEIWRSELSKADRRLDLLLLEVDALCEGHQNWIINMVSDVAE